MFGSKPPCTPLSIKRLALSHSPLDSGFRRNDGHFHRYGLIQESPSTVSPAGMYSAPIQPSYPLFAM